MAIRFSCSRQRYIKAAVFALCLLPLALLIQRAFGHGLGANPIEAVIRNNGNWALRLLLITLAITPLRGLTRWGELMRLRRMLGLFAFFYASVHLLGYVVLDQFFAWSDIWADILKRPYITIGVAAYLLLLPLAVTSTNRMIRRLGARRWKRLHRLVYAASFLGVLHFFWLVKADVREPLIYGAVWGVLMCYRLLTRLPRTKLAAQAVSPGSKAA